MHLTNEIGTISVQNQFTSIYLLYVLLFIKFLKRKIDKVISIATLTYFIDTYSNFVEY